MPERLAAALEHQAELVDEVKKLRASNRLLSSIVSLLLIIVLLLGGLAAYARSAAQEAKVASQTAVALAERQEQDRAATALIACRLRNANNRDTRTQFLRQYDLLASTITRPEGAAFVENLRSSVPTAEAQDRDCDLDGMPASAGDYPEATAG